MKISVPLYSSIFLCGIIILSIVGGGCAQIGVPTGGPKDTLAPKLIRASPVYGSRNVTTNKFTLEFNEYIDVKDLQQNLIVSPLQNRAPVITSNPRSITIRFRDSLLPNTTYTVNFGNAVSDINENNIYRDLSYTFSTGRSLDSLTLSGNVVMAETGIADSTMIVMLYRNAVDSTVQKKKPSYIARVTKDGSFSFDHLPPAPFLIYALKDGDGSKTYNSLSEAFAFTDKEVTPGSADKPQLYAYVQEKKKEESTTSPRPSKKDAEKKLKLTTNILQKQDLLMPLEINFNNPLALADSNKIYIADTFYRRIPKVNFTQDSTAKKITLTAKWPADASLILIVDKDAVKDSAGNVLAKSDTVRFVTKKTEEYGKLTLRFNNLELKNNPVLLFYTGEELKYSYPLTASTWTANMFAPGSYSIRILYDTDKNGKWTTGNYIKKTQPELVTALPQTLAVKEDWENEREIDL